MVILGGIYCILIIFFISYNWGLSNLATALTILSGFMIVLGGFWKLWDHGSKKR